MAKRTTDLLDVFHARPDGGSSSRRSRDDRPRTRKPRERAAKGAFEGIFLNARQVLLGSCVLVLLLVLAFTVGLGMGRSRGPSGGDVSLQRIRGARQAWYIRGQLARQEVLSRKPIDPDAVLEDLVKLRGFRPQDVRVVEGPPEYYWVYFGPFGSEADAHKTLEGKNLAYVRVQGAYPFAFAKIVNESP